LNSAIFKNQFFREVQTHNPNRVSIPFNIEKPLSVEAVKKWNEYGDRDYKERFCHFTGEPSNGETSVNQPVLKNWKKAKEAHSL
jgi:hypothetical protein